MNSTHRTGAIIKDLTLTQLSWASYLLFGVILFFWVVRLFTSDPEMLNRTFLDFIVQPGSVFMLILGLSSVSGFLTFLVKQGVTRRTYYTGVAVSGLLLTLALTAAGLLLHFVFRSLISGVEWLPPMGYEGLAAVPVIFAQLYLFYLMGWAIGATFYRFGVVPGLVSIACSLALLMGLSYLIGTGNDLPSLLVDRLDIRVSSEPRTVPLSISLPTLALVAVLLLALMRLMTKRIRIKIK